MMNKYFFEHAARLCRLIVLLFTATWSMFTYGADYILYPGKSLEVDLVVAGSTNANVSREIEKFLAERGLKRMAKDGRDEIHETEKTIGYQDAAKTLMFSMSIDRTKVLPMRVTSLGNAFSNQAQDLYADLAFFLNSKWPGSLKELQ